MTSYKIINARIINEGEIKESDILIKGRFIEKVDNDLSGLTADTTIDAGGKLLFPGIIDDQVHFREPGLTHKATIYSEARAAVSGGITSFMEMPNTVPNALTQTLLEDKYQIAATDSLANYSFYMGASNNNMEEILKTDRKNVCGIKIFMGSSTGNMLVDNQQVLENIFANADMLIATHCEDESLIRKNTELYREKYGDNMHVSYHPEIRSAEACYLSSSFAVELAKKHGAKLHILHISSARETKLFDNSIPLKDKKITAEACIHHLYFNENAYTEKGNLVKWNPAIKTENDRKSIFTAMLDDRIDVIATDHAPHTLEEKSKGYFQAPSGGPLVQHALPAMLEFYRDNKISLEKIAEKMCHNPAILFQIHKRGFIREGYYADLVLVDPERPWTVNKDNILAKCGWSPFEGHEFRAKISHTFVSGHLAYENGKFNESQKGMRMIFDRE